MRYAAAAAVAVMLLTCVPYAIVWWSVPRDGVFPFILFNSDDQGVYYAWMRQAHDGQVLFRNLFTTEPQRGAFFHAYFLLLLGWLSRVPGIDIPIAYHLGRLLCGVIALVLVYRLACFFTESVFARRCALWNVALSGGVGWLLWADQTHPSQPVDVWQPEALTFPSLYTNSLFCVSLALMLGVVVCLLLAETDARRGVRWAIAAGLCGLALGNVHSYDVIHLTVAWVAYLLGRWAVERRFPAHSLRMALLAALVASPSVAYMAWLYLAEPVFKKRADTATWSPVPTTYLLGYGVLIPLALLGGRELLARGRTGPRFWPWASATVVGGFGLALALHLPRSAVGRPFIALVPALAWAGLLFALRRAPRDAGDEAETAPSVALLLPAWVLGGFVAAYLPFAFQRKMIMGTHVPLALLAGLGVAALAIGWSQRARRPAIAGWCAAAMVLFLSLSSVRYLLRDVSVAQQKGTTSTSLHPVYWPASDLQAFAWLSLHAPASAAVLIYPTRGVLVPAYSGRAVYAGHWAETPDFPRKLREANAFYSGMWDSATRRGFLAANGITHVIAGPAEKELMEDTRASALAPPLDREAFLEAVLQQGATTVYRVR